jgi:myo-inositol 2-dehydrogenase/D-chiro-inositol 1-dehydrogenase
MADGRGWTIKGKHAWEFKKSGPQKSPYQVEHDDFFAAIRNNIPYNEAEYGATSTMTAIMGRMATYSGREIDWDTALASQVVLAPDEFSWDAKPKAEIGPDGLYPMPLPGDPEWFKKII